MALEFGQLQGTEPWFWQEGIDGPQSVQSAKRSEQRFHGRLLPRFQRPNRAHADARALGQLSLSQVLIQPCSLDALTQQCHGSPVA
jgi:hypothetical protein